MQLLRLHESARWISMVFYFFALTQDCYCTSHQCEHSFGILLFGWAGLYMGGPMMSWLANPLLFVSWLLFERKPLVALSLGITSAVFMLSFLFFKNIYDSDAEYVTNIVAIKSGYWLWLASSVTITAGAGVKISCIK